MRAILIIVIFPCVLLCQEFYPGSLSELDSPICYNTSVELAFETPPSLGDDDDYTYQWQKFANGFWFDILNENSTTHITDTLTADSEYRVIVGNNNMTLPTNSVNVYVLPPLEPGTLLDIDSICINYGTAIEFEIAPFGAELSWGGFSIFDYEWEQGNILDINPGLNDPVDWVPTGFNSNTHIPSLEEGLYFFRCFVTSPHGCGTVVTDPILIEFVNCLYSDITEEHLKKEIIKTINILGQNNNTNSFKINIYEDGAVDKKYILK